MNPNTFLAPVVNRFLDKAERHIKYIVSASSYVSNLQKKREVLNARINDINGRIDEGKRISQRPTDEVLVWRNQAVDMLDRVDTALNIAQETRSCVCSICSKHKLGHSCDDMIKEVDELLGRASLSRNAEMMDCDTSNIVVPMPYVVPESQELYFAEACKCTEDDNSNVNIIGIWGLGDDLWKDVDLHKVGVPNPNEGNRCGKQRKVIFTTRSKAVCGNMEARKIIEVKCLDSTQSWVLFTEKVGHQVIQSHPSIPKFAEEIAKECNGLPLALITIGRAMSTKSDIDDWRSSLNLLKNSQVHHVLGVEEQLLSILKISYDCLATEQLRKCFPTISMWPENEVINTRSIIEFWIGIDLIDNFESNHEAYQIGHSIIRRLQAACLLEEVAHPKNFFIDKLVKMHDILRDLALWLVSDCGKNKNKWMIKAGMQLRDAPKTKAKWREAECISLMCNKIEEIPLDIPTCPSLLTLVLRGNNFSVQSKLYGLGKFHCLNHLDLSWNNLHNFPESICELTELRYLNLYANNITNLPMKLRNLKKLKYLVLRCNYITNIPSGLFAELADLLVLDMFEAIDTEKCPSVDVEELKSIEKNLLSFGTTVTAEEELSKLMLLSELSMDKLCIKGLHSSTFHFMAMIRNVHRLKFLSIEQCSGGLLEIVFDGNEIYQDIASLTLEILWLVHLHKLKRVIWKDIIPEILFAELRTVIIHECRLLEDITWVIHLQYLKYLSIKGCESMRIAINDVDPQILTFPSLERFSLMDMEKLEKISIHSLAFPQLEQLYIFSCPLLKSLPLDVKTTPKLRKIEGRKEWWEVVEWEDDNSRPHFNQFFHHYEFAERIFT